MAYMRQVGLQGLGEYEHSGDWTWEFYPPPYDFLAPADSVAMPAPVLYTPGSSGPGLGCACGGSCGHCSSGSGGWGGLGLFETGMDLTGWGVGEYVAAAGVAFLGFKLLSGIMGTTRAVRRTVKKRSASKRRRAELMRELEELG